ncbi:MAG: isoprenyl transferase [Prevotellaceae bacterium]|jgi:undecaprenyl diphosphate synthase|nr:isoprenyl transferase [Prevotellaceae bacterium]
MDGIKVPEHIAIIMDGNGRWAKKLGLNRIFGHRNGVRAVRETVETCGKIGVKYLTLYAFSMENWNRPSDEIEALMSLLIESVIKETSELDKNNVQLRTIGNLSSFPENVTVKLNQAIEFTSKNTGLVLTLALSYGSRWEITEAVKKIAAKALAQEIEPENINENVIEQYLTTYGMPDPELIIRTSGEQRLSNFLLWQGAYSEFYFPEVLWPDFKKKDLMNAIDEYRRRERRFGKTGEQIKQEKDLI